jgi:hypothetical protein
MMEEMINENQLESPKRPMFLTVLCVLTFIYTILLIIFSVLIPPMADVIVDSFNASPNYNEEQSVDLIKVIQAGWGYYGVSILIALCSATGAFLMWRQKKMGLLVYALSNLGLLFVPTLFLGIPVNLLGILITAGFIGMYGLNFKSMK